MKSIVYDNYGGPEVLKVEELEAPRPRGNEALIRIRAVEATKADCEMRSFRFPVKWFALPLRLYLGIRKPRNRVLGSYFAGEIVAIGKNVTRFSIGDRVFGCGQLRMRAYAEYATYPESFTIGKMPEGSDYSEAASALLGGLNALHFLNLGQVSNGDRVLINGGGGSIGLFAIQIAKARGAEITAVDKSEKEDVIRHAGADHFIDYEKIAFGDEGNRYDLIFNMVPGASFETCMNNLDNGGRYLVGNPRFSDLLRTRLLRMPDNKIALSTFAGETMQDLDELRSLIEEGQIKPIVDQTLPFEHAATAHALVESERRCGAIVLEP